MGARFLVLILLSLLFRLHATGEDSSVVGTAVFMDASSHPYLRHQEQINSMSSDEVVATVSVLMGFAPPTSFVADSSSKLNQILLPNPFSRPRAVLLLEVDGSNDALLSIDSSKVEDESTFKTRVLGASKAEVQLEDENVLLVCSEELSAVECGLSCVDEELSNLASWLGGSYLGSLVTMDGILSLPLASGQTLNLQVGKEAELQFASSLVSLLKIIKKGVQNHEDFSGTILSPAEMLVGHFTGIKALEEEYGSADIVKQGTEVFQTALFKAFALLQKAYEGKIVGVVIYKDEAMPFSGAVIDVTSSSRVPRWLEENSNNATIYDVALVRQSLAWITGIILLVSTFFAVCLLMNMPLTRDTLLYSNVKLD